LTAVRCRGRFEEVKTPLKARFIIDYAHNEVSLESALRALKELRHERLIVLFGCIGGRAQMRREPMGRIAAELADFLILTSDNPDHEPPLQIIAGIERGIVKADRHPPYVRFADRADAVRYAVRMSREGDIILFAGKGHEDYQIIDGKHVHFSEREIIEEEALELSK
jgi:UDP-N-acetylmuramoyl-L-alanyl-D-glutamate--2,6-diaminopimelate ligase